MNSNVVDYGFYLIQRGEAGHRRGCYTQVYKDSGGVNTIGYGTVTDPGYNSVNFRGTTVTEEQAISLAKEEMAHKINEKCRKEFKDFDNLLPCYQALILDTTYQGCWGKIQEAMNSGNYNDVYQFFSDPSQKVNSNKERAMIRARAIEMGILIEQIKEKYPNADPKKVADILAQQFIQRYENLNGTDLALTKDELALLYRSCMFAYGQECSEEEIRAFVMNYDSKVVTGVAGICSENMAQPYGREIPQLASYSPSRMHLGPYQAPQSNGRGSSFRRSISSGDYALQPAYRGPLLVSGRGRGGALPRSSYEPLSESESILSRTLNVNKTYSSPNVNRGVRSQKPSMIVIHSTEGENVSSAISWFQNPRSKVSAHVIIDKDGTIYQMVGEKRVAWHAGGDSRWKGVAGCNKCSLGIELVHKSGVPYTKEQYASLNAVVKCWQQEYGIRPDNVVGHADVVPNGRKTDPSPPFTWEFLIREGLAVRPQGKTGAKVPEGVEITSADCSFYKDKQGAVAQANADKKKREEAIAQADAEDKKKNVAVAQANAEGQNGVPESETSQSAQKGEEKVAAAKSTTPKKRSSGKKVVAKKKVDQKPKRVLAQKKEEDKPQDEPEQPQTQGVLAQSSSKVPTDDKTDGPVSPKGKDQSSSGRA